MQGFMLAFLNTITKNVALGPPTVTVSEMPVGIP
jgi:hypothetical protein